MTQPVLEFARQLAARPYTLVVDRITEGEQVFIAYHPELEFVVAQGDTPEAAIAELAEMRLEVFVWLLESGLLVPPPQSYSARELLAIIDQLQALPEDLKPTPEEIEAEIRNYWAELHQDDPPRGSHGQDP